jgi:hypothetical protein
MIASQQNSFHFFVFVFGHPVIGKRNLSLGAAFVTSVCFGSQGNLTKEDIYTPQRSDDNITTPF